MEYRFAKRMELLRASEIREILKITANPDIISFAGGLPAPEHFPLEEARTAMDHVLREEGCKALQYSTTEGDMRLREWIAARMNQHLHTRVTAGEIMITSGSQQGLDLSGRIFIDEGDAILCESPTYLGAIQAFRSYLPRFDEIPVDDEGMLPEALTARLARPPVPKLIYVVPDFQNPSGRCWSLERRRLLLSLAEEHGIPIIEDSPYHEIRFTGTPLPSLKSMDRLGLVVFLGTFSKIFCPGLRIGWLASPPAFFEKYVMCKQGADLHTSTISQAQLVHYFKLFDLDENLAKVRETYRRRREVMLASLETEMPAGVRFTRPEGGLFIWVEMPEGINARDVLLRCLQAGVAFVPGGAFFPNGGHENTMRLNFSNMPEPRIQEGIRRLGTVLREMLGSSTAAAGPA